MASDYVDDCMFTPASGGTGNFVYSAAVTGYRSPVGLATDGATYEYRAQSSDLSQWENGSGVWTAATSTLARTTITASSNAGAAVNFTNPPQVGLTILSASIKSLVRVDQAQSFTATQQDQGRANLAVMGKNIIINGDFRINQGSYVSAAALASGSYAHDRWKAGASGGDYSFTQLASSTQITIAASKSLIQVVEDKNVVGGSYVLSWTGTATARVGLNSATPSGNFAVSPVLITGQTAGTTMSVEFTGANAAGGSTIATNNGTLGTVQLEQGAVASPFERRLYQTELALCQRYCFAFPANSNSSGIFGSAVIYSTALAVIPLQFPQMRAGPTATLSAANQFLIPAIGTTFIPSAISVGAITANSAELDCTISGATAGTSGWFRCGAGLAASILLRSEL